MSQHAPTSHLITCPCCHYEHEVTADESKKLEKEWAAHRRAVNSHATLVEALKDILAVYHGLTLGRQDTEWEGQFKVQARAALVLAERGQP